MSTAEQILPNPRSPYANAVPTARHLLPGLSIFGRPIPGKLAPTACDRMALVPDGALGDATNALAETRLDDLPPGLCRSCVLVATAAGRVSFRQDPQTCRECGGASSQGEWCALCRQELHDKWWPGPQPGDPIDVLDLSIRPYNTLKRARIHTIGDLTDCTPTDITDIRNSGVRTLEEIKAKLAAHGLALRERQGSAW